MDEKTENAIWYWMIGIFISLWYVVYWFIDHQRRGKLTEEKSCNIIVGSMCISLVWPIALFVTSIYWGSVFLNWFTKKVIKVKDV